MTNPTLNLPPPTTPEEFKRLAEWLRQESKNYQYRSIARRAMVAGYVAITKELRRKGGRPWISRG